MPGGWETCDDVTRSVSEPRADLLVPCFRFAYFLVVVPMAIHPGPAAPDGPYPVGATRFVRSVREHLVVGQSRLCPCKRGTRGERTCSHAQDEFDTLDPTLIMDEIEFLAFYPADVPTDGGWRSWLHWGRHKVRRGMRWFVRPVSEAANGYEAMMGECTRGVMVGECTECMDRPSFSQIEHLDLTLEEGSSAVRRKNTGRCLDLALRCVY
jgi:hypothetical protein